MASRNAIPGCVSSSRESEPDFGPPLPIPNYRHEFYSVARGVFSIVRHLIVIVNLGGRFAVGLCAKTPQGDLISAWGSLLGLVRTLATPWRRSESSTEVISELAKVSADRHHRHRRDCGVCPLHNIRTC